MPLVLYYRPSFKRCLKQLDESQKKTVALILESLEVYYSKNCDIVQAQRITPRFFYKKLRNPYYEAGIESNVRVVLRREAGKCIAILAGNHDQIRKFLANV